MPHQTIINEYSLPTNYGRRSENPRMTDERLETSENSHGPPATDITNEYVVSDVGADFTSISLVT